MGDLWGRLIRIEGWSVFDFRSPLVYWKLAWTLCPRFLFNHRTDVRAWRNFGILETSRHEIIFTAKLLTSAIRIGDLVWYLKIMLLRQWPAQILIIGWFRSLNILSERSSERHSILQDFKRVDSLVPLIVFRRANYHWEFFDPDSIINLEWYPWQYLCLFLHVPGGAYYYIARVESRFLPVAVFLNYVTPYFEDFLGKVAFKNDP